MPNSVFAFTGETVVVLSPVPWERSSTHPAIALAAHAATRNTVVLVEPAPGVCETVAHVRDRRTSWIDAVARGGSVDLLRGSAPPVGLPPTTGPSHRGAPSRLSDPGGHSRWDQTSRTGLGGDGFGGIPPSASVWDSVSAAPELPAGRLYRVRPRFAPRFSGHLPRMLCRMLRRYQCTSVVRATREACVKLGVHRPIVIAASTPEAGVAVSRALSPQLLAYYACDDGALCRDSEPAEFGECGMLQAADLVIASTDASYHRCARFHADPYLVRFGIDFDHYRLGALANPPGPRPCIGYLGPIDEHVDTELVERLSRDHPGCDVLFVGPIVCPATADALDAHANVTLLGARNPQETPVWLRSMDVCLVPLRPGAPTRTVYQQVHAYFAAGKPVVVPPGRAPSDAAGLVDAMSSPTDTAAVLRALRHNTTARRRHRIDAAREADWSRRVAQITTLLRLHLRTPPVPMPQAS